MKITAKENDINDMQLSYKHGFLLKTIVHWTSNACQLSAANKDFDPEKHYISLLFITCDLCFSFR